MQKNKKNIAVLISNAGSGTNLQAIIDGIESGHINGRICVVVSDSADAYGLTRARIHHVPTHILTPDENLTQLLQEKYPSDFIALAGWKKIIPDSFITAFPNRILNLHPGAIPDTYDGSCINPDGTIGLWNRGKFTDVAIKSFLDARASFAASSIHYLTHQFDFGPVLGRTFEKIEPSDTVESLYSRLKIKENKLYQDVLMRICNKETKMRKTILVIGSGAREHTIGWKLSQSVEVERIYFAPGNAGTARIGTNLDIAADDVSKLLTWATENIPDLTVVGPEAPLVLGIVDEFRKVGLPIFGPTKEAARLEESKAWATEFMMRHNIPHPKSVSFADISAARTYVEGLDWEKNPCVVKADGLALGKGVFIPNSKQEALDAIEKILLKHEFKDAGNLVVLQERLSGYEVSIQALSDGMHVVLLPSAQDNKRIGDGDTGPNTGGVGALSPVASVDEKLLRQIETEIVIPTIEGMRAEGRSFTGLLYPGLMITAEGPKVLEYNIRFGDPETQVVLSRLTSDLLPILEACASGTLRNDLVTISEEVAVCVVLSAKGYPDAPQKGDEISLPMLTDVSLFHAGTKEVDGKIVTSGGRVLSVVATGNSIDDARGNVYAAIGDRGIHFDGMQYRRDIGLKKNSQRINPSASPLRIEVYPKVTDTRGRQLKNKLMKSGSGANISDITVADVYTIDATLDLDQSALIVKSLSNEVAQKAIIAGVDNSPLTASWSFAIEIGFLPGVTDNIGNTAKELISDTIDTKELSVYSSQLYIISGTLSTAEAEVIAQNLYNPLIQRASIKSRQQYEAVGGMEKIIPKVSITSSTEVSIVDLHISDEELALLGKLGIKNSDGSRRGPLALDLPYLKAIRRYFDTQKRNPTDIELESIAQTWSEHCKHTIFADPIDEIEEGLYAHYIKKATQQIREKRGKDDICVSVFSDNSGAIIFDDEYLITDKVETHNSPSALDPFGGAITGIVGVNRDALGFGLGAKPVLNRYGFCVADPRDNSNLYRDTEKQQPLLSSARLLDGIIAGVNSGGNCSGIPTPQGFLYFDERFRGKPLVFVGTVGLIPREKDGTTLWKKEAQPGDYIVVAGGRVGLDGIHGATFSSEALTTGSPATAVQIGDPITQKKLSDVIVKEARDKKLYTSITDNGAGGISCSVAEMAKESGGCIVQLEKVPLKYPGLQPWQIWISESQERMTFAVPPSKWAEFSQLLKSRGVESSVIGTFTRSGKCIVTHQNKTIVDLDMQFLHDGLPPRPMKTQWQKPQTKEPNIPFESNLTGAFTSLINRLNIASIESISQQYDHEVQGTSVLKPLQGKGRVNADATVVQPLLTSHKGVVVSQGLYPTYTEIDPYHMATASVDTAIRNSIVSGAQLSHLAILDNFCWCSSTEAERLGQLKRATQGLYDSAMAFETPIISGKDSMFNDFKGYDDTGNPVKISIPPTLLISSLGVVADVTTVVSLDTKSPGDLVYLLGETHDELGGSEYYYDWAQSHQSSSTGTQVPEVNFEKNKQRYCLYSQALQNGLIASAISVGRGGLAAALAKTALGGKLGLDVSVNNLPGSASSDRNALFSESQGRILVTIDPKNKDAFESLFMQSACANIGTVTRERRIKIWGSDHQVIVDISLAETKKAYTGLFGILSNVTPHVAVLTGYGINCEEETAYAFNRAGATSKIIHVNDLIRHDVSLASFEMLAIPGGFAYGDDTGSGNAFAQKMKNHLWEDILEFVHDDHLVIGICNGFQVLVNLGLLPALKGSYGERSVALLHNDNATYTDRWVDLEFTTTSPWTQNLKQLSFPIAHGEGKFYADAEILDQLERNHMIAAKYVRGNMCQYLSLQANPNGSLKDIAAITDQGGTIFGIMPHPERAITFTQLPNWPLLKEKYRRRGISIPHEGPGMQIFRNGVAYFN